MSSDHIIVQTTFDNQAKADEKAEGLKSLFHATNIKMTDVMSFFWWEGKIDRVAEQVLTAKINVASFNGADAYISKNHGYNLPCVIAFDAASSGDISEEWPTDCVLAETMFVNLEMATLAANKLVECCLAACTKIWPTKFDAAGSLSVSPYCLSIETTDRRLQEIEALTLPGKISPIAVKPIIAGKPEFLDWIRDCVAMKPREALDQALLNSAAKTPRLIENRP